jgi:hypothetical protein
MTWHTVCVNVIRHAHAQGLPARRPPGCPRPRWHRALRAARMQRRREQRAASLRFLRATHLLYPLYSYRRAS